MDQDADCFGVILNCRILGGASQIKLSQLNKRYNYLVKEKLTVLHYIKHWSETYITLSVLARYPNLVEFGDNTFQIDDVSVEVGNTNIDSAKTAHKLINRKKIYRGNFVVSVRLYVVMLTLIDFKSPKLCIHVYIGEARKSALHCLPGIKIDMTRKYMMVENAKQFNSLLSLVNIDAIKHIKFRGWSESIVELQQTIGVLPQIEQVTLEGSGGRRMAEYMPKQFPNAHILGIKWSEIASINRLSEKCVVEFNTDYYDTIVVIGYPGMDSMIRGIEPRHFPNLKKIKYCSDSIYYIGRFAGLAAACHDVQLSLTWAVPNLRKAIVKDDEFIKHIGVLRNGKHKSVWKLKIIDGQSVSGGSNARSSGKEKMISTSEPYTFAKLEFPLTAENYKKYTYLIRKIMRLAADGIEETMDAEFAEQ